MTRIPITKPVFGPEEHAAIQQPLSSGWVVQGPLVAEFERKFAEYTAAAFAVATSNCTTALHVAVATLGLQPGDEVIVPAFTWVSTANVVEYMGARPIFCDVDLATFNIDVRRIETLLTSRTVGIIPVHLFGLCADMEPILELARHRGLWVTEDGACAFGAWYRGKHAGTFGNAGCFSFHPRKSITTGEGGMITTAGADLAATARSLRDHGASRSDHDRHKSRGAFSLADYDRLGYNYRMTDIQGALGLAQLDRAEWILERRRHRARLYDDFLRALPWLRAPIVPADFIHGYQAYVCLFAPEQPSLRNVDALHLRRNALMARLEERGIATRQGTHAAALVGHYRAKYGLQPENFPNAFVAERLSVTLPLYPQMTDCEQEEVVTALRDLFE